MNDTQQTTEFLPFAKIPRLSRDIVVTEKLDGTNAQILITPVVDENQHDLIVAHSPEGLAMLVGSRTRWIRVKQPGEKGDPDNYGFAAWCKENAEELFKLGPGRHYGEWFGRGINRGYGLTERRFALFNVSRWLPCFTGGVWQMTDPAIPMSTGPACCSVVPVLYRGEFDQAEINRALDVLRIMGSVAAPGFMNPEGIVIFHTAGANLFKKTIKDDESPKSMPGLTAEVFQQKCKQEVITDCQLHVPQTDRLADYAQNQ